MIKRLLLGLVALALCNTFAPAYAQGISQKVATCNPSYTGRCFKPDAFGGDPNNAAFTGEVALVVGTPDTSARRSLKLKCTVIGDVAVTYADGTTGTWTITSAYLGPSFTLPISITTVNTSGTTATCTYANLK